MVSTEWQVDTSKQQQYSILPKLNYGLPLGVLSVESMILRLVLDSGNLRIKYFSLSISLFYLEYGSSL